MLVSSHLKRKKDQNLAVFEYKIEFHFFYLYNHVDETISNHYLTLFFLNFFQHHPKLTFHKYDFLKEEETTSQVVVYLAAKENITKNEKNELCNMLGKQLDQLLDMLQNDQQQQSIVTALNEQQQMIQALSKRMDHYEAELEQNKNASFEATILATLNGNTQLMSQLVTQIERLTWQVSKKNESIKKVTRSVPPLVVEPLLSIDHTDQTIQLKKEEKQFKLEIVNDLPYFKEQIIAIFELFTMEETPETIKTVKQLFVAIDSPIDQLNYCLFYWQSISRYTLSRQTCKMNLEDQLEFLENKLKELPGFLQEIENNPLKISPKTIQFDAQKNILGYAKLNTLMGRYYKESFAE